MMKPKTEAEIEAMRRGGRVLAEVFEQVSDLVSAGKSTKKLADEINILIEQKGGRSAVIGYEGFPEYLCISINEEVVHGIPSPKRIIKQGDLVSVDLTIWYEQMVVDSARTYYVGDIATAPKNVQKLMEHTKRALHAGIDAIHGAGTKTGEIGAAVQAVLDKAGLGIVRDLVGHGVGYSVHEDPNVPNYGLPNQGVSLPSGLTIAVEPMATLGDWHVNILPDDWTVVTRDSSLAAHFEHTVLINKDGAEILTS